jgi:hypothetical protein
MKDAFLEVLKTPKPKQAKAFGFLVTVTAQLN